MKLKSREQFDKGTNSDGFYVIDDNGQLTEKVNFAVDSGHVLMKVNDYTILPLTAFLDDMNKNLTNLSYNLSDMTCIKKDTKFPYYCLLGKVISESFYKTKYNFISRPAYGSDLTYTVSAYNNKGFVYNSTDQCYYSNSSNTSSGYTSSIITFNNNSNETKIVPIYVRAYGKDVSSEISSKGPIYIAFSTLNTTMTDFVDFTKINESQKDIVSADYAAFNSLGLYTQAGTGSRSYAFEIPPGESSICVISPRKFTNSINGESISDVQIGFRILDYATGPRKPFYVTLYNQQDLDNNSYTVDGVSTKYSHPLQLSIYATKEELDWDEDFNSNKETYPILQDGHTITSLKAGIYNCYFDGSRFHINGDGSIPNVATESSSDIDMRLDTVTNTLYITDDGTPA